MNIWECSFWHVLWESIVSKSNSYLIYMLYLIVTTTLLLMLAIGPSITQFLMCLVFWKKLYARHADIIILSNCLLFYYSKLVSTIFYQIFIFSPNDSPSQTVKSAFFFHLKSSFCFRDIQIFVIFPLPFHIFQIQKDKWKWNNLWCLQLAYINLQVKFLE